MLTHIVCWKYKPETTDDERVAHIEKLNALTSVIPEILSFSVGRDILHLDRSFDTGLVSTFEDRAALDSYSSHPQHVEAASFGREICEKIVSVDFLS